jgi:hypothetical protein
MRARLSTTICSYFVISKSINKSIRLASGHGDGFGHVSRILGAKDRGIST